MRRVSVASILVLLLSGAVCHAQFASTFDTDNENWRFSTIESPFHAGSGPPYPGAVASAPFLGLIGNPAGSIGWTSDAGGYQYFLTPLAWNGDRSYLMGGFISWDYSYTSTEPWANNWGDIAIRDTANNRWIVADATSSIPPQSVWNTFTVSLDTSTPWRIGSTVGSLATNAEILAALTNMGGVYIRGDVIPGTVELYQLDNFRWAVAVPEAGTTASLAAFLSMGLVWMRRRLT